MFAKSQKYFYVLSLSSFLFQPIYGQIGVPVTSVDTSVPTKQGITLNLQVDAGSELLAIMMWLAGKYPAPMDSAYKSEVWSHFSKYRKHPALELMRQSELFPDFTAMGLQLSNFPDTHVTIPTTSFWYDKKGGKENTVALLNGAKDFATKTGFWSFYRKHQAEYDGLTNGLAAELKAKSVLPTIDSFFHYGSSRPSPQVTIYLEPLNNWGAHAIDFQTLRGQPNGERVTFQIGPVEQDIQLPDTNLAFTANRQTIQNVWHESSHIYLRKSLIDYHDRIAALLRLFNAPDLASQNIKTWDYAFEEKLVRAIVAAVTKQNMGEDAYKREVSNQTQRGFIYTGEIAELILAEYISNPNRYQTFDDFLPLVVTMLEKKQSPADAKH